MSTATSFCRVCQACCGVRVSIEGGQITDIRGDPDNPLSRGYICSKGRESPFIHHGENRLRECLCRDGDGRFVSIDGGKAIEAIADRLQTIVSENGPDAVGLFIGTYALFGALTPLFARSWLAALGSRSLYTTGTIDQSAKWIAPLRAGRWLGGWQDFAESDVWLLNGTNPLVSMQGGNTLTGFPAYDPVRRLREAQARGLKLIVIDPRRTETARKADIHLQPRPGFDALLFACFLRIILEEGLHDGDFCEAHSTPPEDLLEPLKLFEPAAVAALCDVEERELFEVARTFGNARRGMAHGGTGPDMGPQSNLVEHLIYTLNVVCGRFARAGERIANPGALSPSRDFRAVVAPPDRQWEASPRTAVGDYGTLWGERPTTALPDQILTSGEGRVRALIVVGGNPMACWPDQERTEAALEALDLLVVLDPRLTATARHAHYVIAPTLPFERPDHTIWFESLFPYRFAQYTPALVPPPAGTIEDWRFFHLLSRNMGLDLKLHGHSLDLDREPEADELLEVAASGGSVPLAEVKKCRSGVMLPSEQRVAPADSGSAKARFDLLPTDVAEELALLTERMREAPEAPFLLIVRRARWVMNSYDKSWASAGKSLGEPTAWVSPGDLKQLCIADGDWVRIASDSGEITARLFADDTLKPGVVSMPHCQDDAATSALVNAGYRERINAMPVMSAIPVSLRTAAQEGGR